MNNKPTLRKRFSNFGIALHSKEKGNERSNTVLQTNSTVSSSEEATPNPETLLIEDETNKSKRPRMLDQNVNEEKKLEGVPQKNFDIALHNQGNSKECSNTVLKINDTVLNTKEVIHPETLPVEDETDESKRSQILDQNVNAEKKSPGEPQKNYDTILLNLIINMDIDGGKSFDIDLWKKKIGRLSHSCCKRLVNLFTKKDSKDIPLNLDVICFKLLLKKWNGYLRCNTMAVTKMYDDLYKYLNHNWSHIESLLHEYMNKILVKTENVENGILVECPLNSLKTLFYFKATKSHIYNVNFPKTTWTTNITTARLCNWPFVSIRMSLPNFEMVHQNYNHDEFTIINLKHRRDQSSSVTRMNTNLHYKSSEVSDTFLSSFVIMFISQLKFMLSHQTVVNTKKRDDIMIALKEFTKDIVLATDSIDTNTEYYANFTEYPYIRYLGNNISPDSDSDEEHISVRLKQTTYPAVKFELVKFSSLYKESKDGKISFILSDNFTSNNILNNCLSYECTLCAIRYSSYMGPYELSVHLVNNHGFEPNWMCSFCGVSFSTEDLSVSRWSHSCKSK